jgi:hypothetical protein
VTSKTEHQKEKVPNANHFNNIQTLKMKKIDWDSDLDQEFGHENSSSQIHCQEQAYFWFHLLPKDSKIYAISTVYKLWDSQALIVLGNVTVKFILKFSDLYLTHKYVSKTQFCSTAYVIHKHTISSFLQYLKQEKCI